MPAVVVVGSVHVDLVASARRLPRPGETLPGTSFATYPGGKAGNQAVQVALLGVRSFIVGRIGRDPFGERLRAAVTRKGVDTRFLTEDPGAPTGVSSVLTGENGEYASVIVPGAAGRLGRADLAGARDAFASADVLLLQLEIAFDTVAAAIELGRAAGLMVVLNAAPAPDDAARFEDAIRHGVDFLIVNRVETEMLSGMPVGDGAAATAAAATLLARHRLSAVLVTLGADGAVLVRPGGVVRYPPWPVSVVDTIGAGDAFAGTFAASLARGSSVPEAAERGNAAGALAVTQAGAYDALPSAGAVGDLLASRRS